MNDYKNAEKAAKELTLLLKLPSWKGSVFAWLKGQDFVLKICADKDWLEGHRDIPKQFQGFKIETDSKITGVAFDKFKMTKIA